MKVTKFLLFINLFALIFSLTTSQSYAQNYTTSGIKCPDYVFTRDLKQGDRGDDVMQLQKLLNADYRTKVAPSGVASPGYETTLFGVATRESVKRFQALFIEMIGIANGKVGPRTKIVLNSVCKSPYFTNGGVGSPFDGIGTTTTTPKVSTTTTTLRDMVPPTISLTSFPNASVGIPFRIYINSSEPIKQPNLNNLYVLAGGVTFSDMRKISPASYSVLVTQNQNVTESIRIQIEAEAVEDLAGNKNAYASNELNINTIQDVGVPSVIIKAEADRPYTVVDMVGTSEDGVFIKVATTGVRTFIRNLTTDLAIGDVRKVRVFIPDITPPGIIISAPATIYVGDPYRITMSAFEEITAPNLSDFVVSGNVTLSDLQKIDSMTYTAAVTTTNTGAYAATIQYPAFKVFDKANNGNTASNLLSLNVIAKPVTDTGTSVTNPYTGGDSGSESGSMDPMQLLMMAMMGKSLFSSLSGLLGNGSLTGTSAGGDTGGVGMGGRAGMISPCACMPARRTIQFIPLGLGVPGYYFSELNPSIQPSCSVQGIIANMLPASPANICGQLSAVPVKGKCPAGFMYGGVQGCCLNPQMNMMGQVVVGTIPPPPVVRGCGL